METITINGVEYVKKDSAMAFAANECSTDGLEYCIIRTYAAGVHAGYVESRDGTEVVLRNSRRIWKWAGAFTLSELSKYGTKDPGNCKFATPIDKITLTGVIEIINCTQAAKDSILGVADYEC